MLGKDRVQRDDLIRLHKQVSTLRLAITFLFALCDSHMLGVIFPMNRLPYEQWFIILSGIDCKVKSVTPQEKKMTS